MRNRQRKVVSNVKLPAHKGGASRARSGEQVASKGNFVHIVLLDPAYKAGLAEHVPVKAQRSNESKSQMTNFRLKLIEDSE